MKTGKSMPAANDRHSATRVQNDSQLRDIEELVAKIGERRPEPVHRPSRAALRCNAGQAKSSRAAQRGLPCQCRTGSGYRC